MLAKRSGYLSVRRNFILSTEGIFADFSKSDCYFYFPSLDKLVEDDIIMINENSYKFYLQRIDYFSFDFPHFAFRTISVNYGKKERWSNAKLIYSQKDLENFINNGERTIWFTVYPENYLLKMNFYKKYEKYLVTSGIDNMIKLYKFLKP